VDLRVRHLHRGVHAHTPAAPHQRAAGIDAARVIESVDHPLLGG